MNLETLKNFYKLLITVSKTENWAIKKKSTIKNGASLVGLQGLEPCDLIKALKWAFIPKIKCRARKSFDRSEFSCPLWGGKVSKTFHFRGEQSEPEKLL